MNNSRCHLLQIITLKNQGFYQYIPLDIIKKIQKLDLDNSIPFSIAINVDNNVLSFCIYKNLFFLGVEQENNITFQMNLSNLLKDDDIIEMFTKGFTRLYNFAKRSEIFSFPLQEKWKKTIPLLDKVVEIQENHKQYNRQKNQYKEFNISNNGYIQNENTIIDKCVCLYECNQIFEFEVDYNNFVFCNNEQNEISLDNIQLVLSKYNKNEQDIIYKIINGYKEKLISEIDELSLSLYPYHMTKKNFPNKNTVEIQIDKDKIYFFKTDEIHSIEKCLNDIMILKEQDNQKEKKNIYEQQYNIDVDNIEKEM